MHYANGREAKLGDLVRGKGYNLKHEFTGMLVGVTAGTDKCNAKIATITSSDYAFVTADAMLNNGKLTIAETAPLKPQVTIEYSECALLVAIDPSSGEVLPPVEAATQSAQPA